MAMHPRYGKIADKLRYTDLFLFGQFGYFELSSPQLSELFWREATNIFDCHPCMRDINKTMVIDCCLYGLFLYHSLHNTARFGWADHAPNYWLCDGIIQGDRAREISYALHPEISFECDDSLLDTVCSKIEPPFGTSFLVRQSDDEFFYLYQEMPYRWISLNGVATSKKEVHDGMLKIVACASSIFLSSERTESPLILQSALFEQCNLVLRVLVLSYCAFSFVSPPFLCCQTLRFLGLDHCTNHKNQLEGEGCTAKWACLDNLWVLDQRYTDWDEILSEEKMDLMRHLTELNIEGVRCWQYTSQLQKRLPHLERLRITKPVCQAEFSKDIISNSFTEKKRLELELLDLSGNIEMRKLPACLSMASNLQVLILDGCDQLENVVLPNVSSLRSFSFDGCGAASNWTSSTDLPSESSRPKCPSDADKKDVKTTIISLEGCKLLENLFLRGLPNLEELDLSGSAIKILDFKTMVVDVPRLKRLILIGCEHLRAIIWGDKGGSLKPWRLELLCVDTRAGTGGELGCMAQPSLISQHKSSGLQRQRHATITDARLVRSLSATINHDSYYRINITSSSSTLCGSVEETSNEMIESSYASSCDHRRYHVLAAGLYADVFNKVGDTPALMQDFPHPPTPQLDRHIEIGNGSRNVQSEVEAGPYDNNLGFLMRNWTQSMHVHDVSAYSNTMAVGSWYNLKWCRIERCSNLEAVFPPGAQEGDSLETIWASDLLKARCIWSQGRHEFWYFQRLRHLHLRSCPSLRFAIPVFFPSFPELETIHIIHCSDLRRVFAVEKNQRSVTFPSLTTIHLHDLPSLQQICGSAETLAPALKTIKIRGCPNLRRLPALRGRELGMRRPTVEVEKDVWDALKWSRYHRPSLYEAPVHSRYYKQSRLLRGTVLR